LTCSQFSGITFSNEGNTMRMTSKGQVTIPKHIREKLGVKPGDEIGFREEGQAVILENANTEVDGGDMGGLAKAIRKFGEKHLVRDSWRGMTTDEIMEELRGYSEDANDPGFQRRS
jgi:AbrB family looped-hinge helix DNA binding protein